MRAELKLLERDVKNITAELRADDREDHTDDLVEKLTELEQLLRKETADFEDERAER